MNLFGVPALAGPIRLRKCHRLKPGLQTRRGSWLRFTLERGSRLSMNRVFGVHPLGCPKRKDTLKRGHRTALFRFMVPMRAKNGVRALHEPRTSNVVSRGSRVFGIRGARVVFSLSDLLERTG